MSENKWTKDWHEFDEETRDKYIAWGFGIESMQEGELIFRDKHGKLMKAKQADVTLSAEKSQSFDEIKAVMDLPETSIGETFTKLRKVKEIVEGME